jgi:hypothetical protein
LLAAGAGLIIGAATAFCFPPARRRFAGSNGSLLKIRQ